MHSFLFSNIYCAVKFASKTAKLNINSIRNNNNNTTSNNSSHRIPFVCHQIWHIVCEKKWFVSKSSQSKSSDLITMVWLVLIYVYFIRCKNGNYRRKKSRAWFLNYSFISTRKQPNSTKLFVRLENMLRSFPCEHNNNGAQISLSPSLFMVLPHVIL